MEEERSIEEIEEFLLEQEVIGEEEEKVSPDGISKKQILHSLFAALFFLLPKPIEDIKISAHIMGGEVGGPRGSRTGAEPTRYGDWEVGPHWI